MFTNRLTQELVTEKMNSAMELAIAHSMARDAVTGARSSRLAVVRQVIGRRLIGFGERVQGRELDRPQLRSIAG